MKSPDLKKMKVDPQGKAEAAPKRRVSEKTPGNNLLFGRGVYMCVHVC